MKTSGYKIGRAYIITAVCCLCITAFACGYVIADGNTREIASGFEQSVAAAAQTQEKLTLSVDDRRFEIEIPKNAFDAAQMLPAPLGCLVAIARSVVGLAEQYL